MDSPFWSLLSAFIFLLFARPHWQRRPIITSDYHKITDERAGGRTDAFVTRKNVSKQLSYDNGKHLDGRSLLCIHAYTRTMIVWLSCASKLAQTAIDLLGTGERAEPADWITGADTDKYLPGPSAVVIPHPHRLYCVHFCVGNLRKIFSPKEIRHLWRRVNNEATDTVYCCLYPSRNNLNF